MAATGIARKKSKTLAKSKATAKSSKASPGQTAQGTGESTGSTTTNATKTRVISATEITHTREILQKQLAHWQGKLDEVNTEIEKCRAGLSALVRYNVRMTQLEENQRRLKETIRRLEDPAMNYRPLELETPVAITAQMRAIVAEELARGATAGGGSSS